MVLLKTESSENLFCQGYNVKQQKTYCNPINLSYRFCLDKPSRREAADPVIILFKNVYYLFASKSGGYFYSDDLTDWKLIETKDLPVEEYAPAAVVVKDTVYFIASGESSPIFKTTDPKSGKWQVVNAGLKFSITDPALFYDDDSRLYLYWGCSNKEPLYGIELDLKNNLQPIGERKILFGADIKNHGWERPGEDNLIERNPWFEGPWMNKYKNKYYLQYAAPGTEFKGYADGVYTSENPFGPFTYQASNPFSLKQGGFACGAGHSSTFQDKYGNYWHVATQTISVKHMFERRLAIFPTAFDADGILFTNTAWGDYPQYIGKNKNSFTGWMLLSYKKTANASSSVDSLPVVNAFDEDIRTYWSAKTGDAGEWLSVDLGRKCKVNAVQINFAEEDTKIFGRMDSIYYQYIMEYSNDGLTWHLLIDKSKNKSDVPHDYVELNNSIIARYIKINNSHIPDGKFAISGLRIFGKADVTKSGQVKNIILERDLTDLRNIKVSWQKDKNATGYMINYGISKDKLYNHLMIYEDNSVELHNLNTRTDYYFSVDSFNEAGVTIGKGVKVAKAGR
ncbi:MAG: carbohydrate-binding protein [Ignavibacteriales bacterium]|nr:MAG: carbohydrate-binding protein [Ignavibacteriales bacterium]